MTKEEHLFEAQMDRLLMYRCINCYNWLNPERKTTVSIVQDGKWLGENVGPFCQRCYDLILEWK